jgi:hypothetical protein
MTMNKIALLLASVALIASSLSAAAAEIPAKYRGEWCDHISGNFYTRFNPNTCQRRGLGYMRFTTTGYETYGLDNERCHVVKVNANPPGDKREQLYFTADHLITFTCTVDATDGDPRPQSHTSWFGITSGKHGRGIRLYIEPLDSDQKDK